MQFRSILAAAGLVLAAFICRATPLAYNASDIWWDPNESGWGLNVIHQGDTLFATLFVYGSDGSPRWYSASSLVAATTVSSHDRPLVFSGPLHESTGPALGTAFDPARVTRRQVGTMTFQMFNALFARLTYSVDGVQVTRDLQRYTFRVHNGSGTYVGFQVQPADGVRAAVSDAMTITINQGDSSFALTTSGSRSGTCNYLGSPAPYGQLVDVPGHLNCADGRDTPFKLMELDWTRGGFTARMTGNLITAPFQGRFVGARAYQGAVRGDGWRTDLWWVPSESGWGVNIIEQGDVLFTTFFVYDANGRAKWYSASLFYAGNSPNVDASGRYTGTVYESSGPYFGGSTFNPNLVTRRAVGTATLEVIGNRTGWLDYSINGVTERKTVDRFTFRTNDPSGTYVGHLFPLSNDRGVPTGVTEFDISTSGGAVTIATRSNGGNCTFTAPASPGRQYGQHLLLVGNFTCTNGRSGTFFIDDLNVSYSGFTALYTIDGYPVGSMAAARSGTF
jgi:hypothetical protein